MGTYRRINVNSGRQLEQVAHYSRALRAGNLVLQSGTTAIDREGNVYGEGDMTKQVDVIMAIAQHTMGKAGGKLEDVVRTRLYITDISKLAEAGRAMAKYFRDVRPASTLVHASRLARPAQLIEIELDAIDGAKEKAVRISSGRPSEEEFSFSRAVRMGDMVFLSGTTARNQRGVVEGKGDMYTQTQKAMETLLWALEKAGGSPGDLVNTRTFLTNISKLDDHYRARLEALGKVRPSATLLGTLELDDPTMLVEIEGEAIIGASKTRRDIFSGRAGEQRGGYSRAVKVGDWVYVTGSTSMSVKEQVEAVGDVAGQSDKAHETIKWALEQAGATTDDVLRHRAFTIDSAPPSTRKPGEGPDLWGKSWPVSMGCRIASLTRPEILMEAEAVALIGAKDNIEWIKPDPVDPTARFKR